MTKNTHTVQAESLDAAMQKAREQYGPDALILETREVLRRESRGLGLEKAFELIVSTDEIAAHGRKYTPDAAGTHRSASMQGLQNEIDRIERMSATVSSLGERLSRVIPTQENYPLENALVQRGASRRTVDLLAADFGDRGAGRGADRMHEAILDLKRYLRTVDTTDWRGISGVHIFFGSGGCGKTSLIIKLAGKLVDSGGDVAVVMLFPRHGGEISRFTIVEDALGVDAAVAYSIDDFKRCIEQFASKKTVLVDTPCILTVKQLVTNRFYNFLSKMKLSHRHFVFNLDSSEGRLKSELDAFERLSCQYASFTKLDISEGKARILDVLVENPLVVSFVNESPDFDRGLKIPSCDTLLSMLDVTNAGNHGNPDGISVNAGLPPAENKDERESGLDADIRREVHVGIGRKASSHDVVKS